MKRKAPEVKEADHDLGSARARKARLEKDYFLKQGFEDRKLSPLLKEMQQRVKLKELCEPEANTSEAEHAATVQRKRRTQDIDDSSPGEAKSDHRSQVLSLRSSFDDGQVDQEKLKSRRIEADKPKVVSRRTATEALHEAVSNQQENKRRRDAAAKAEDDEGAVDEAEPQLPGIKGGAHAI